MCMNFKLKNEKLAYNKADSKLTNANTHVCCSYDFVSSSWYSWVFELKT